MPRTEAEIEDRRKNAGLRALEPAEDRVLDGILDMPLLRDGIDEAERLGAARIDGAAGEHQGHRLQRIDQAREARGAAKARMQAEHHLGEAEARAVDRDPHLAGERDLEAAAEAEAVDHGDVRHAQRFEAVDHRMGAADGLLDRVRIARRRENH